MPSEIALYEGVRGAKRYAFGKSRRNTIRWGSFGRFFAIGGFGNLAGDLDFWDKTTQKTICSFRAACTVDCAWGPDGRHFLTCTTAPRMRVDNQISIFKYDGLPLLKLPFDELYAAAWRPAKRGQFSDRPASPGAEKR